MIRRCGKVVVDDFMRGAHHQNRVSAGRHKLLLAAGGRIRQSTVLRDIRYTTRNLSRTAKALKPALTGRCQRYMMDRFVHCGDCGNGILLTFRQRAGLLGHRREAGMPSM